jgi:hypothetical protein
LVRADEAKPAESAVTVEPVAVSGALDQDDRE